MIGDLRIEDVRARHLAELFTAIRVSKKLAPKSIYNAYGVVKAMFRDAKIEGLVREDPCCLTEHQLGPNVDKDPEWRDTAYFTAAELTLLISDTRIPPDRRVFYALEGLGGLRLGEAAGLRWKNVDLTRKPLGALKIATSYDMGRTKTKVTRHMPIHPTLAAMLAEWKLTGWAAMLDRQPQPDDLVCPMPKPSPGKGRRIKAGAMRDRSSSWKRFDLDQKNLGLTHRRGHDLRRTFISLARQAGAREDVLKVGTHGASREVIDRYTTFRWEDLCEAVSCLKLVRPGFGQVIQLASGARQAPEAQWAQGQRVCPQRPQARHSEAPPLLDLWGCPVSALRLCLVACGSAKLDRPAPAGDLYTGALFRDALGYAQAQLDAKRVDVVRILSAKYGLLRLDEVVEPYDLWLGSLSKRQPTAPGAATRHSPWRELAERIDADLWQVIGQADPKEVQVTVLGGAPYVELVEATSFGFNVLNPLKGLTQGARRAWFKREREASR